MNDLLLKEIEHKYLADHVKLTRFQALMAELPIIQAKSGGSWDVYFTHKRKDDRFQRLRMDPNKPQLTRKVKIEGSNRMRIEHDIELKPGHSASEAYITSYLAADEYEKNFKIYKAYELFFTKDVNYVYYVVFDEEMRERERFIEVEINKDRVPFIADPSAMLDEASKVLERFDIYSRNRLKQSLYERYRR